MGNFDEKEAENNTLVTELICLMKDYNVSYKELSDNIGYSYKEVEDVCEYVDFNRDLVNKAFKYIMK